jgi:nicotinate phosphoribosyltransferase
MTNPGQRLELLTDLYELTMAASYFENAMDDSATFSLFIRKFPSDRAYFVAAGLQDFLEFATSFHFSDTDLAYLEDTGTFSDRFLRYLKDMRFTGSIHAIGEGEVFFENEPIVEVTAPILEAQILETFAINTFNLQSMIATKAARCIHAAADRRLVDFSLRRTHGADAGLKAARSSYIAGFVATSNVLAGKLYGIPITGTMAHSYISAFENELEAYRAYARSFPDKTILLIDTYDTVTGAKNASIVGQEMAQEGHKLLGVRLDSGDMASLSRQVRKILDDAGLHGTDVFASSSFDEYKIAEMIAAGAMIDAFGVGTKMGVSSDAPYFDMVYKLVKYGQRPVMKLSTGKANLPGEKQIFRRTDSRGRFREDVIGRRDEKIEGGRPLLEPVVRDGQLLKSHPSLDEIRERFRGNFELLDDAYKALRGASSYPVTLSPGLEALRNSLSS